MKNQYQSIPRTLEAFFKLSEAWKRNATVATNRKPDESMYEYFARLYRSDKEHLGEGEQIANEEIAKLFDTLAQNDNYSCNVQVKEAISKMLNIPLDFTEDGKDFPDFRTPCRKYFTSNEELLSAAIWQGIITLLTNINHAIVDECVEKVIYVPYDNRKEFYADICRELDAEMCAIEAMSGRDDFQYFDAKIEGENYFAAAEKLLNLNRKHMTAIGIKNVPEDSKLSELFEKYKVELAKYDFGGILSPEAQKRTFRPINESIDYHGTNYKVVELLSAIRYSVIGKLVHYSDFYTKKQFKELLDAKLAEYAEACE